MRIWFQTAVGGALVLMAASANAQTAASETPPASPGQVFEIPSSGPSQPSVPAMAEAPPATGAPVRLVPPDRVASPEPEAGAGSGRAPAIAQQPASPAVSSPVSETCRDGTYAAIINGRPQTVPARLCQQPDGTWSVSPQ